MFYFKKFHKILMIIGFIAACSISYFRVFESHELLTYDWRCQIRGPRPVSDKIVLIEIAEDALRDLGPWPIDRGFYADFIETMLEAKAAAVVFDVMFSDSKEGDAMVTMAARVAKNVYFSFAFSNPEAIGQRFFSRKMKTALLPSYMEVAKGMGFVNGVVDLDGKHRKAIPVISCQKKDYLPLGFKVAFDALGIKENAILYRPGKCLRLSKDLKIPLDDDGYYAVSYSTRWTNPKGFKHYSFRDVLQSKMTQHNAAAKPALELGQFKGKICIVGMTATGSTDLGAIPLESSYPMMGIHANIINNILQKDFVCRMDRRMNLMIAVIIMLLIGWLSWRLKPLAGLFIAISAVLCFVTLATIFLIKCGIWIDLFYPTLLIWATYTLIVQFKINR